MFQLAVIGLDEASHPPENHRIPARLPEHVGADQPLHHDGQPGGKVIPLDHHMSKDAEGSDDAEADDEPGRPDQHLRLPHQELQPSE